MIDRGDRWWYKDTIIYQLHIKAFFDANGDGVGDIEGLIAKLDYVRDLGATAIWLMPFYPSPLRDDGYDISDYRGVNPTYGSMKHFKRLIREAHSRGLRIITELVINHTSDQHPWFKRSRLARTGSNARDFYVWSDTPQKFEQARIIFLDTEASNWSWDPVAKAYYWHRFYSHQPDLNFDNPRVLDAVIETMRYWLDIGVDGLRLDAIPYLIEREGTNCENLPETHEVIRKIRVALDESHPDRMLLAEANQWPEETAQYFGNGDECHMAFHFPLMPRMYMALALEDRHPITDIMRQTPDIPSSAQWAIFLRNHDELTLEMVTDRERDYLWTFYASDRQARINLGIRRRLAPLLGNDRRKTELLSSLLFSMPGAPVLYYGDEIGMGDNIYLGDRDGVRTPMQWSPDRNGGFSRADPAKLYLPAIQDPIYGYASVNVESQLQSPASLLNWTRRMIAIRRNYKALSRGQLRFIYPDNRKVLAYVREYGEERILCIANVSRAPQAVELDLSELVGATPIELTGGAAFPQVGSLPYMLTLPGYGFYWFLLDFTTPQEERFGPSLQPELFTLVLTGETARLLEGREAAAFERTIAPRFLAKRRWFAGGSSKDIAVKAETIASVASPSKGTAAYLLVRITARSTDGAQDYFAPLAIDENGEDDHVLPYAVARVRRGARIGLMYDADADPNFGNAIVSLMKENARIPLSSGGELRFDGANALLGAANFDDLQSRRLGGDQTNSTLILGDEAVLKIYRRLQTGVSPEVEMSRFLTESANFEGVPAYLGAIEQVDSHGDVTPLAVMHRYVRHQGDGWTRTLDAFQRALEELLTPPPGQEPRVEDSFASYLPYAVALGRRTAQLHVALSTETEDPSFVIESFGGNDVAAIRQELHDYARAALQAVSAVRPQVEGHGRSALDAFVLRQSEMERAIDMLTDSPIDTFKLRVHGDYHLAQVLVTQTEFTIVDFEGEPSRPVEQRRAKDTPMRDIAGMLRSIAYAGETAILAVEQRLSTDRARAERFAADGVTLVCRVFMKAYDEEVTGSTVQIRDEETRRRLLRIKLLSKALYEINYEAAFRPTWIAVPTRGALALLDEMALT